MTPGGSGLSCMAALHRTVTSSTTPGSGTAASGNASSIVSNDTTLVDVENYCSLDSVGSLPASVGRVARMFVEGVHLHPPQVRCRDHRYHENVRLPGKFGLGFDKLNPADTAAAWQLRLPDQRIPLGINGLLSKKIRDRTLLL